MNPRPLFPPHPLSLSSSLALSLSTWREPTGAPEVAAAAARPHLRPPSRSFRALPVAALLKARRDSLSSWRQTLSRTSATTWARPRGLPLGANLRPPSDHSTCPLAHEERPLVSSAAPGSSHLEVPTLSFCRPSVSSPLAAARRLADGNNFRPAAATASARLASNWRLSLRGPSRRRRSARRTLARRTSPSAWRTAPSDSRQAPDGRALTFGGTFCILMLIAFASRRLGLELAAPAQPAGRRTIQGGGS